MWIVIAGRVQKMSKKAIEKKKMTELAELFKGDDDLFLFYLTYIKCGLKAGPAYREIHPDVTVGSAEVMGHRLLSRVKEKVGLEAIAVLHGMDLDLYLEQLKEGNIAMKRDQFSGEMYPDHAIRLKYHDKLGKILGIEQETSQPNIQVNVLNKLDTHKKDYNLDE